MKNLAFIVNIDWFFHSHRRSLQEKLSSEYRTTIIAGSSGLKTNYEMSTFEVKSRVPTVKGLWQLFNLVNNLPKDCLIIAVSPGIILLCHFLFRKRPLFFYNFSGFGFLRTKSAFVRITLMKIFKFYPVRGKRICVVQNIDDYSFLYKLFGNRTNLFIEIIPGSGFENSSIIHSKLPFQNIIIGYVGRIRKDKGILDLIRAVSELEEEGYSVSLKIWGKLDDQRRHGFNDKELQELKDHGRYFMGFSDIKSEMYCQLNWFCLPSSGEGLSRAAIEATSYGLPLLLSDVQGNRDMVKGNGFLFKFGDVENLKKRIIEISDLPETEVQKMSERSRALFESSWTLDSVYGEWNKLLVKYDTTSS